METCLVIFLIGLIFTGLFQVSQLAAAREILEHAAARSARARTVGFNSWMVRKSGRVAAIPNAGRLIEPAFENVNPTLRDRVAALSAGELWTWALRTTPQSPQYDLERVRIPLYMDSDNRVRGAYILDYEDWDSVAIDLPDPGVDGMIHARVTQNYPLRIPMHRAFYATGAETDRVRLQGETWLENHYSLYLDDQYW